MASRLHRQAALASTLEAQKAKHREWERTLATMRQKAAEKEQQAANSNWHEGRLAAIHEPPSVYPVVVGERSVFKRPEDLSAFFGTVENFPTSTVFELDNELELELDTNPDDAADIVSSKSDIPTLMVCEIDDCTNLDLQVLTKGEHISVWFQGKCRAAWLPKTLQEVNQPPSDAHSGPQKNSPAAGESFVLIGDLGGDRSMFKTAEELRDFLLLSDPPQVVQTTATNVKSDKPWEFRPGNRNQHHYPARHAACLSADQYREVENRTSGRRLLVWFPNNVARYTWVPGNAIASHGGGYAVHSKDYDTAKEKEDAEDQRTLQLMERKAEESEQRYKNSNWQEAAVLACTPQPPQRFPVVIGDDNLFKSAQAISSFLGTTDDYPTSTVYELSFDLALDLSDAGENAADLIESQADSLQTISICEVYSYILSRLEEITQWETVDVWLGGECRSARRFKSLRNFKQHLDGTEQVSQTKIPETQFPVIVGNRGGSHSMFETAEDLRSYLSLPEAPAVIQTVETDVDMSDKRWQFKDGHSKYPSRLVSFVNASEQRHLQERTYGRFMMVWFPGNNPKLAWFPASPREDEEAENAATSNGEDDSTDSSEATPVKQEESSTSSKAGNSESDSSEGTAVSEGKDWTHANHEDSKVDQIKRGTRNKDKTMPKASGCGLWTCFRHIGKGIMRKFRR